jgi:protein-S-isoprenylcysteine O-methyltransferase Ste14
VAFATSVLFFVDAYGRRYGWDAGSWTRAAWRPTAIDLALFTVFAMHHSLFARMGVKSMIAQVVPADAERSVYVWIASVLFFVTCWWWQPVPGVVWRTDGAAAVILICVQFLGGILSVVSVARLGALELAGVTQPSRDHAAARALIDTGLYGVVRHPIYFGWLLVVWPTPMMTGTRFVFAVTSTIYLMLAVPFEERDLRRTFGPAYIAYATRVRWRMLPPIY